MGFVRVPRRRAVRLGVVGLVAAMATGMVAAPAAAEEGNPGWVYAWLSDTTIGTAGTPARTAGLELTSAGAVGARVSFDLGGLAGVATATFPDWCVTDAAAVTCPMPPTATPDEWGAVTGQVPVVLRAVAGAADGATGTIGYTVSADGVAPEAQQATVTVAAGPALIDLVDAYVPGPTVGERIAMPVALVNAGDQSAQGLQLTMRFPVGLTPAAYRNCRYGTEPVVLATIMVCVVPGTFAPGQPHEVRGGIPTRVTPAALGDKRVLQLVEPLDQATPPPADVTLTRRPADSVLRLRQVGEPMEVLGPQQQDQFGQYYLRNIHGAFDLVAVGGTVTGAPGETVQVRVGIRNDGPGVPDNTVSGGEAGGFLFTPPAGTTVVAAPWQCRSYGDEEEGEEARIYYCTAGPVWPAGDSLVLPFDLRIDGPAGAAGEVRLNPYPRIDDNPANDVAPVTLA